MPLQRARHPRRHRLGALIAALCAVLATALAPPPSLAQSPTESQPAEQAAPPGKKATPRKAVAKHAASKQAAPKRPETPPVKEPSRAASAAAAPASPPPAPQSSSTAAPPPAPAPEAPGNPIGEFQPVLHAQGAKITTCMDTIVSESASVIDSAHTAVSSWASAAPDDNLFLSMIGLSYANKAMPNAAAIILAAPTGAAKCKGATLQVYPVAQTCSAIQASMIKDGRTIGMLQALPVVETKAGIRNVLLPTAGGGCVIVAVALRQ